MNWFWKKSWATTTGIPRVRLFTSWHRTPSFTSTCNNLEWHQYQLSKIIILFFKHDFTKYHRFASDSQRAFCLILLGAGAIFYFVMVSLICPNLFQIYCNPDRILLCQLPKLLGLQAICPGLTYGTGLAWSWPCGLLLTHFPCSRWK